MSALKSKLTNTGTSIFTQMSQLAIQHQAINLSQGFPDFDCSPRLIALVEHHLRIGHNQYAPMAGLPLLRERIGNKVACTGDLLYNPDTEITITAGATQALFTTVASLIRPGDEVILFEPAYDSYAPSIQVFGGFPRPVALTAPDFAINWETVAHLVNPKTRLIIVNSPNNPTARVWNDSDYLQLARIIQPFPDCCILSDEVYEHLVYDGIQHRSPAHYPALRDRTFVVASFGKLYHTTGWKVGYCLAPADLTSEFRKVHQFNVFSVNTPIQHALADFLVDRDEYLMLSAFFQQKRDFLLEGLTTTSFRALPCEGTYFLLADYSAISDLPEQDFCQMLTKQFGVATIPVSAFYHQTSNQQLVRICFAKQAETLERAMERLSKVSTTAFLPR